MKRNTMVSINKMRLKTFKSVVLNQEINDHHTFEVIVDYQALEAFGTHTLENSRELEGEPLVITFGDRDFLGVITDVELDQSNGFHSNLVLSGYSPTIILEGGEHIQSWLCKDLASIVQDIVGVTGRLQTVINPAFTTPIEYQCQYCETHFQFLKRLAKQYNEWFYYDGVKLVFGKPSPLEKPIPLAYDKEIIALRVGARLKPHKRSLFTYNTQDNARIEAQSPGEESGLNELGIYSFRASQKLYPIEPNRFAETRVKDRYEVDIFLKNKQAATASDLHSITATSTYQELTVGSVIKVSTQEYVKGELKEKRYGEYLITHISHSANDNGEYINQFRAIGAGVNVLPEPEVKFPRAEAQIATVISNEDPQKQGRVQVQFQWQTGLMKSSWLQVMSPDAGKSDNVGTNRGFVHIPEVGDEVMIGFRYSDPNRPFVMGSLFNGTTGTGGSDKNKIKSLTTRTGSTITFDDAEGKGKITISDPSGNIVTLNGDETMTLSAPKSISMTSKEIAIIGEEKVHLQGKEVTIVGTDSIKESSESLVEIQSSKITASCDTTAISASKTVDIEGGVETNVKGAMVKLN